MRRWSAGLATLLVAGAVAGGVVISGDQDSSGGITCDQTVSTRAALATALGTTASSGQTICVDTNLTGAELLISTDMTTEARVVAQPRDGTVDMVAFACNGCSNITIDGFEFTGSSAAERGIWVGGTATNFHWVKNNCHDIGDDCVHIQGTGHTGFWAVGNTISRYEWTGTSGQGYGIFSDTAQSNAKFNYNECVSTDLTNGGADCMEIGQCATCEWIGNTFDDILDRGSGSHADFLMVWNDSSNVTVRDNRAYDSHNSLISPDTNGATIDNNLFVQMTNGCVDADPNGSSGDVQPLNWTVTNNTVLDCGLPNQGAFFFDDWRQGGALASRGGNTFQGNIIGEMSCIAGTFGASNANATGNVFEEHAVPCSMPSGSNQGSFDVTFSDAVTNGDYVPTNLPGGYEDAGYRAAPAGPDDCPESECGVK